MSVSRILFSRLVFTENISFLRKCSSHNVFNIADNAVQAYLKRMVLEHKNLMAKTVRTPEESKRLFEIKPIVNMLERRNNLNDNIEVLKRNENQIEDDEHTKKRIEGDIKRYAVRMTAVDRELQSMLLEPQFTDGGVLLEVTAGSEELVATQFAQDLFDMYERYAEYKDWAIDTVSLEKTYVGFKKASMFVEGFGVPELMKIEAGVHRVIKTSDTEKGENSNTSTVLVAVLPRATEKEVDIPEKDMVIENTSIISADDLNPKQGGVRITHTPSGTMVECQGSQSQTKNKEIAIQNLRTLLLEKQRIALQSDSSIKNEQIRTYNYPENSVTEHRGSGLTLDNLNLFLNGEYQLEHMQEYLLREHKRQALLDEIRQFAEEVTLESADT